MVKYFYQRLSRRLELEAPSRSMSKELTQLHSSIRTLQGWADRVQRNCHTGNSRVLNDNDKSWECMRLSWFYMPSQCDNHLKYGQESIREIKEAQLNGSKGTAAKSGKPTKWVTFWAVWAETFKNVWICVFSRSALRTVTFSDVEESFNSRARDDNHFSPDHVSVQV